MLGTKMARIFRQCMRSSLLLRREEAIPPKSANDFKVATIVKFSEKQGTWNAKIIP